jgi:hypothetical protein
MFALLDQTHARRMAALAAGAAGAATTHARRMAALAAGAAGAATTAERGGEE